MAPRDIELEELARRFNDWLLNHFRPQKSADGSALISGGLVQYEDDDMMLLRILLGGSFQHKTIKSIRSGKMVWTGLIMAIKDLIELDNIEDVLELQYQKQLKSAKSGCEEFYEKFGKTPNGSKSVEEWVALVDARLQKTYRRDQKPYVHQKRVQDAPEAEIENPSKPKPQKLKLKLDGFKREA